MKKIIQIQKNMEYTNLKQILRDKDNSKVKVKVLRTWDAINIANNNDLISLDMILVDKEGTLIHASIRKSLAQSFRPQLIEGSIYTITNFLVEEYKGNYRPVHNDLKILFNSTTSVTKFKGFDHSIPQVQFEFADYGTIASRCYNTTYLTDVIGILDYIGAIEEIKTRGRPTKIRNIQLLLEENKSVQTTLLGNTAQQIDDDFYKTNKGPFIVIVTSTIVKTFRGQYQLSSTFATKLYVNLNIPEVAEMRNNTKDINVKDILPKGLPKIQDAELALHNKKTVVEIKNLEWNLETKNLMVTCNAKIININNKYGWYYVACLICKTKVKQVKGVLWCERCKNEPKFAVPSYRIQVQVQDETGSTTFISFDKGAEKIISKTAKELVEMQEEMLKLDENTLPKEIQKIIGNEYLFQLHLDEYNLKYGKENYTVSKILEMEISHKQKDSSKVEEHQDTMEEIVRKSRKDKYIASQKIEIGETSVQRPERMPLQMLQKHQKSTKQIATKKKKN
ncbi:replication protein A 70 kDa DNA-binding subunit A-like isoform X2 [Quercus lobata]|uniref:replication protein A 70 kDa DNA-binding subunit A-like isoform X2 n=1 Tax=Quercus lobata TaxID=97700 RepID=UPI0012478F03|nr:replication protein A 70 kDa DNA-binding subunit A-like isoform X2 [Quercus lobata]